MNPDTNYIKGFNDGYLLGEHAPTLAEQLAIELNGQGDYASGFVEGHLNRKQELLQNWLREVRDIREQGKDIDRDSISEIDR